ncbi:MAG: N-acetylmuramoyl-L-alanine amidase [Acidobacteriota bacterium]
MLTVAMLCSGAVLASEGELSAPFGKNQHVVLDSDLSIFLVVTPEPGDAWTRLALRATGNAVNWKAIADLNGMNHRLSAGRDVRIPLGLVKPEMRRAILAALFPADRSFADGMIHRVTWDKSLEGESLWKIAEWFTGDGANYASIRSANSMQRFSTRPGDLIRIPRKLLSPEFVDEAPATSRVAEAEDDPTESRSGRQDVIAAAVLPPSEGEPVTLDYGSVAGHPFAVYKLKRGEALYSSVAIRFSGRVYAKDVNDVVDQVVRFNGIADVSRIPAGFPVKIPMELLLPEYRPAGDPKRLADEQSRRESARLAKRVEAKDLSGVYVILDPGHGGRDIGTSHEDVWESDYVYDVACRLKALLEKKTRAKVFITTRSPSLGYKVPNSDLLTRQNDHVVLTSPNYLLENTVVGVHLRWYLANSIFSRAIRKSTSPEKVVFISIHADSLHASLRGAMAYIPGEQYVQGTFSKSDSVYLARSEVREHPTVRQTEEQALLAEGLSTEFAETLLDSFRDNGLPVHPFNALRDNVVRDGREWVPAVIRYNMIPTRMLLEICNFGNDQDRALAKTRVYRQSVAEALEEGIVRYFAQKKSAPEFRMTAKSGG